MTEQVFEKIREKKLIREGDTVLIGVSGGADSVCLLFLLRELQRELPFSIEAVHIEHGIRGEESRKDALFVENLCKKLNVPCVVYTEDVPGFAKEHGLGLEEAARIRRYACYEKRVCALQESGTDPACIRLALAHHAEDNAETVLFQLVRGSGMGGLCGMEYDRQWKSYRMIRPLLGVQRAQIEAYLAEKEQDYCTDATNLDMDYSRNRIRHKVLPELREINGQAVAHINQTAELLSGLRDYLAVQTRQAEREFVTEEQDGLLLHNGLVDSCPQILVKELIHDMIGRVSGSKKDVAAVHVGLVEKLFSSQIGRQVDLPYQIVAKRTYEGVLLGRKKEKTAGKEFLLELSKAQLEEVCAGRPGAWDVPGGVISFKIFCFSGKTGEIEKKTYTKWFDYDKIKCGLQIRTRKTGDYLTVDESGHTKKLKEYLINEKIPREKRDEILLVTEGAHVLWAVGGRISAGYKVSEHTKRILEVQFGGGKGCE